MDNFMLDKSIWTQDDFEMMGWHDANIQARSDLTSLRCAEFFVEASSS
jgi:hypothetical protein